MSRQLKPLKLRDVVFSGSAAEGIVVMRAVDGPKVLSKRFSISELMEIRDWISSVIRQHRYQNYHAANIEQVIDADVETIRQRFENGESERRLADEFKLPLQVVMGITRT